MRLHRLEVQALQAFATREVVDFDALGAAGLFLLHGDTGAGKTTLLDAVCFAFYGKLPGARGKGARERSDHAEPELRTEVVLEATLRGERLRITRTPKQERPKRRGTGTTEEAATVHLERHEGDGWRSLATRHDEAAAELDRLLGMSREQFCQVVLLPQGEFATFLRADSDTRWEVLERLFATERFGVAEDVLTRRRKEAGAALEAARASVRGVAQRLCQETACDGDEQWEAEPELLVPWLQERLVGAEASRITAGSVCAQAAATRTAADAELRLAADLAARSERHAEAVAETEKLEARRPERDVALDELVAARGAADVAPRFEEADRASAERTTTERAARAALDALGLLTAEPDALRHDAARLRARAGEVGALAEVETELAGRRATRDAEHGRARAEGSRAAELQERLTAGPAAREAKAREYEQARAAADGLADRVQAAQLAHRRREAAAERERFDAERARVHALLTDAITATQRAREHWLDVRQARLDGMAAELAAGLRDGEACLVCGATEHPAPAHGDDDPVDAETERAAQQVHETAEARRRTLEERLAHVEVSLAAAAATAGHEAPDVLAQEAAVAETALDAARRAAAEVDVRREALTAFDREQQRLAEERATAAEAGAAAAARVAAWREELEADEVRLHAALGGEATSVAARVGQLREAAGEREQAADRVHAATAAERIAEQARERVVEAARAAGFADLASARAAIRVPDRIVELEEQLRAFDDALAERRGALADPELQAAAAAPAPDLAGLRATARGAAEAQAAAERADEVARRHAEALGLLDAQLTAALQALAPVAERTRRVRELAYLVDGSAAANRKRMRLSAYVLAARLEEIAAAATVRLAVMTDGRYTIEHSDAGAKGQKRGGLELLIVDGWTGQSRHPATLSGGETFLASLALALGLADVVSAEAGGARLETLFVDEGFGSLDPSSLDMVLDVLDRLRDGGRAVGIVSHVTELRQRIPAQLHVVKARGGSRVEQPQPA